MPTGNRIFRMAQEIANLEDLPKPILKRDLEEFHTPIARAIHKRVRELGLEQKGKKNESSPNLHR